MTRAVDLCAGPGGWDIAARRLGIDVVGIEWDEAACETRRAAGLLTVQGDIRKYGPKDFPTAKGLIASPPCQTFSAAGKGAGRAALDLVRELILKLAAREEVDYTAFDDDRTGLVLEPLRWALEAIDADLAYDWLAFEQVPSVLPVWEAMAEVLREEGYTVVTGKLSAEEYGVPQTRQRAILVARLDGPVALPTKTHRKYKKGVAQDAGDQNLLPWVSMAQALGWTHPGAVGFPRRADSPEEKAKGVVEIDGVEYRARDLRDVDEPSFVVTEKARSWDRYAVASGTSGEGRPRSGNTPAPTVTAAANLYWINDQETYGLTKTGAQRISVEEAALLQSFPVNHSWQGSRTKKFQQIGNAIPPLLAESILSAITRGGV